jgi:hypothetical protein
MRAGSLHRFHGARFVQRIGRIAFQRPNRMEDNMKTGLSRFQMTFGAAVLAAAFVPGVALADGPAAIGIAANHAGLASNGANIDAVHLHLHHVLNCLVGAGGNGFDGGAGNPCMGSGPAIPQTTDAAAKTKLENAATQARGGIANGDVAAAKKTASDIQAMLK